MNLTEGLSDRLSFLVNRFREKLWVRPLFMCGVSVIVVFLAKLADYTTLAEFVPSISIDTLRSLLSIISSSMLVIATFAVASMVSAYASASTTATPRAFSLVVADDASQNALSSFIGAFIFSIVGLISLLNEVYGEAGRFTLFAMTLLVFALVIMTFVRWVDRIARLGRVSNTIQKVESATARSMARSAQKPFLGGIQALPGPSAGQPVVTDSIGYVQRVDVSELQSLASTHKFQITVLARPGAFIAPGQALAMIEGDTPLAPAHIEEVVAQFVIGDARTFDEDPRFGLVVLSEIASRALSPAVNDPGTAIDAVGSLVRLFCNWARTEPEQEASVCERVRVPGLEIEDLLDDAFRGIARDGAGLVEVGIRLQNAFSTLAATEHLPLQRAALNQARMALTRAEAALQLEDDLRQVREAARRTMAVAIPDGKSRIGGSK